MPHSRFDWANRIKATEREYRAVRVGMDWLLEATPDEIHAITEERGWDALAVADIYAADRHLDATYLIRMFSVFERAIFSFWRLYPAMTPGTSKATSGSTKSVPLAWSSRTSSKMLRP